MNESVPPPDPAAASNPAEGIRATTPPPLPPLESDPSFIEERQPRAARPAGPSLIGIEAMVERRPPIGAILLLVVAAGCIVLGVAVSIHFLVVAALPLSTGLCLLVRKKPLAVRFEEDGFRLNRWPHYVAYQDLRGIYTSGCVKDKVGVHLRLDFRWLRLPSNLSIPGQEIADFLRAESGLAASMGRPPRDLESYRDLQRGLFDAEVVDAYQSRPAAASVRGSTRPALFWLGCLPAAMFWMAVSQAFKEHTWLQVGIMVFIIAALLALACWLASRVNISVNNRAAAGMVTSPGGMALVQGPLKGELKWREVQDLKLSRRGVAIHVAGAQIAVLDIYEDAASVLFQRMRRLWARGVRGVG